MNILQELYEHPQNGMENIFIAAFVASDRTYPIFVERIEKVGEMYRADCLGYKWGFTAPDVLHFAWYDDEQLQRETAYRLYTVEQINQVRWQPSNLTVTLPETISSKFRLAALKVFAVELIYPDLPSEYATVMATSKDHVREMLTNLNPKQNWEFVSTTELNLKQPNIHWLTY